jgi:uncharacterized membrane protein YhaH (DUF805 family)
MENLSLFGYFLKCLRKYACFKGRARRKEFWGFMLFYYLFLFVLWFISDSMKSEQAWSVLFLVYSLGTLIPMLAVAARRLHDTDRSGWYIVLCYIPVIHIYPIYLFCEDSDIWENDYGPNPKEDEQ